MNLLSELISQCLLECFHLIKLPEFLTVHALPIFNSGINSILYSRNEVIDFEIEMEEIGKLLLNHTQDLVNLRNVQISRVPVKLGLDVELEIE